MFLGELSKANKNITSACLDVYSNSNYVQVSGPDGKMVNVGTQLELWTQLQRCRVEKKVLEQTITNLNIENRRLTAANERVEGALRSERSAKESLNSENRKLTNEVSKLTEDLEEAQAASSQNTRLEDSLLDIAAMVENDSSANDKEEQRDVVDLAMPPSSASVVVVEQFTSTPKSILRSGSPLRVGSKMEKRRARSASPAMVESTMAAVQSALHRRQLQVHELRTRLSNNTAKLVEVKKAYAAKEEIADATERKLEQVRSESDSLKIKLDELSREKLKAQERNETLFSEKVAIENAKDHLEDELKALAKERVYLEDNHNRTLRDLEAAKSESDRLAKSNDDLSKNVKEKANRVSQLEKSVGDLQGKLKTNEQNCEFIKKEIETLKSRHENELDILRLKAGDSQGNNEELYQRMRQQEAHSKETISRLEKANANLVSGSQRSEENLSKLEEEKLKLTLDLADQKSSMQVLKDQIVASERNLTTLKSENKSLADQKKAEETTREKLEDDLKRVSLKKDELDNQLTSVTLQKDALQDEVVHARQEMKELAAQAEKVYRQNAILNKENNELDARLTNLQKDVQRFEEQVKFLKQEKSEQYANLEELQHDLNEAMKAKERSVRDNTDLQSKHEAMDKQMRALKTSLEDEIARAELEKARLEEEKNEIRSEMEKAVKKLKLELEDVETDSVTSKEELKRSLEAEHAAQLKKLTQEKRGEISRLTRELTERNQELERMRQLHTEEVLVVENAKNQALLMAQQDHRGLAERYAEVEENLEATKQDLEKVRREGSARLEKDRATITDLNLEISRLKSQLGEDIEKLAQENATLNDTIQKQKTAETMLQTEVEKLRVNWKNATDKAASLQKELEEVNLKISLLDDTKSRLQLELRDSEQRLLESRQNVDLLNASNARFQESMSVLEADKLRLSDDLNASRATVADMEQALARLKQDLDSQHDQHDSLTVVNTELEAKLLEEQEKHQLLRGQFRELELQYDSLRDRAAIDDDQRHAEVKEAQVLRMRISELDSTKASLERELNAQRANASLDEETTQQRVTSLHQALDEMRAREKRLEDQRHNLEICLNNSNQQVKELNIKLNGYEGRMTELSTCITTLEGTKRALSTKLSGIATLLRHIRTSRSNSRTRPTTPTTSSAAERGRTSVSSTNRRSSSPWPSTENLSQEVDVEEIKSDIRSLLSRISGAERER